jgi:hypothetical protein
MTLKRRRVSKRVETHLESTAIAALLGEATNTENGPTVVLAGKYAKGANVIKDEDTSVLFAEITAVKPKVVESIVKEQDFDYAKSANVIEDVVFSRKMILLPLPSRPGCRQNANMPRTLIGQGQCLTTLERVVAWM